MLRFLIRLLLWNPHTLQRDLTTKSLYIIRAVSHFYGTKFGIWVLKPSDIVRRWAVQLTLFQPGAQIMPITLLLAHPDLKV